MMGEETPRRGADVAGGDAAAGLDLWHSVTRRRGASQIRGVGGAGGGADAAEVRTESPRALGRGSSLARDSAARLWGRRARPGDRAPEGVEEGPGSGRTFFVRNVAQREIEVGEEEWKKLLARQARRQRRRAERQGARKCIESDRTVPGDIASPPSNLWESLKQHWDSKKGSGPSVDGDEAPPTGPPSSPLAGGTPNEISVEGDAEDAAPGKVKGRSSLYEASFKHSGSPTSDSARSFPPVQEVVHVRQWPIIDVLSPYSWQYVAWQYFMMALDFTYTAFFVPYAVVFFLEDCKWTSASAMVDFMAGWLYLLDVIMNLRVGYSVVHKFSRRLELGAWRSATFYMRRGTFCVDVPATVPVFLQIGCLCVPAAETTFALNVLQFVRLLRLLRLYRPFRLMASDALDAAAAQLKMPQALVNWMPLLQITILYAFIAHLMACIWWFTAVLEDAAHFGLQPSFDRPSGDGSQQLLECREGRLTCDVSGEDCISWADAAGVACEGDGAKYAIAFYFATMTITTVGYGSFAGSTTAEYCVASVLMFIGTLFFGYIVSTTTLLMEKMSTKRLELKDYHDKLLVVNTWGEARNLPRNLMKRVHNYYAMVWTRREAMGAERTIWNELPFPLKASAAIAITSPLQPKVTAVSLLSKDAWKHIAGRLQPEWKPPGEFLSHPTGQGDGVSSVLELDSFYFLEKGTVACLRQGDEVIKIDGPQVLGLSRPLSAVVSDIDLEEETVGFMSITPVWVWKVPIEYLMAYLECKPSEMAALCEGVVVDKCQIRLLKLGETEQKELKHSADRLRAVSLRQKEQLLKSGLAQERSMGAFGSRQRLRAVFEDQVTGTVRKK